MWHRLHLHRHLGPRPHPLHRQEELLGQVSCDWSTPGHLSSDWLSYHSSLHETGHNFGCHHDRDNGDNSHYEYGYGWLIGL